MQRHQLLPVDWEERLAKSSRSTVHNELNGVLVSSDDSSDDDDVLSRATGSTRMTIHNEANGIWVSSDEEEEESKCYDYGPRIRTPSVYSGESQWSSNSPRKRAPTMLKAGKLVSRPSPLLASTRSTSSSVRSTPLMSPASNWSSSTSSTLVSNNSSLRRRRNKPYTSCEYSKSNNNEPHYRSNTISDYEIKPERAYASSEYSESNYNETPHRSSATSDYQIKPNKFYASSEYSELSNYEDPYRSSTISQPYNTVSSRSVASCDSFDSISLQDQTIKLKPGDFWDPTGSSAVNSEIVLLGTGFSVCSALALHGLYLWTLVTAITLMLGHGYLIAYYRVFRWRRHSGIEQQIDFNEMYELAEQVCTDTCMTTHSGVMKPRTICAGELGDALAKYCVNTDPNTLLKFWVEACVHFRLTLKSGCHNLGNGKLPPRSLTAASLGMLTNTLPRHICTSCDNKIAIEAKFPLKFAGN